MTEKSWQLRDIEAVNRDYPYTYYKPSDIVLDKLVVGDSVRLAFDIIVPAQDGPSAERMWVEISEIDGNDYKGKLTDKPAHIRDLSYGDVVKFGQKHIMETPYLDPADLALEKYSKKCICSHRILYQKNKVGFIQRVEPSKEKDSGWIIMGDDNSRKQLDDVNNSSVVSLGAVLNLDNTFIHLLDEPTGSEFEWDETLGQFIAYEK